MKQRFNRLSGISTPLKVVWGLLFLLLLLLGIALFKQEPLLIGHYKANALFSENAIKHLKIDSDYLYLDTTKGHYKVYKDAINQNSFFTKYPVEVVHREKVWWVIVMLLGTLTFFLFRLFSQERASMPTPLNAHQQEPMGCMIEPLKSEVTFKDLAGLREVKRELEEIIDFLRMPQRYGAFGIRLPKGVLLVGPPGVGKTFIAKAVAGEAGVPFFYQSGASFVHIYVGMGAKRVSELFQKAKEMAPSIIFIDEIDAVGKRRGGTQNDEREATLNQLLTEMDGFEESSGVMIIAATNQMELLDEALLRAGRFDRHIHIGLPDFEERQAIISLSLAKKPHAVESSMIARMTVGFNAAALDTLTNEAALYAMRHQKERIELEDFEAVKEKVRLGERKLLTLDEDEREIQALYQGAKLLMATWLDIGFEKIGMVTTRLSLQEKEIRSRTTLLNQVKFYLSGVVAMELHYQERFTNAKEDIKEAKALIHTVVYTYGMQENLVMSPQEEQRILEESMEEVTILLKRLEPVLLQLSQRLLEEENLTKASAQELLREIF